MFLTVLVSLLYLKHNIANLSMTSTGQPHHHKLYAYRLLIIYVDTTPLLSQRKKPKVWVTIITRSSLVWLNGAIQPFSVGEEVVG